MEVSRRRMRHLEPARPLRRLNSEQDQPSYAVLESFPQSQCTSFNSIEVEEFYEILQLHSKTFATKKERISYSREFLLQAASSPMSRRRPDFLPEHPVVLDKARVQDVRRLILCSTPEKEDLSVQKLEKNLTR